MAKEFGLKTKDISKKGIIEVIEACHEQIRQKQGHKPSTMRYFAAKRDYIYTYAPQKKTQVWNQPANTTDYNVPLVPYPQWSMLEMKKIGVCCPILKVMNSV